MSKFQIVKLSKCQSNCQIVTISNVMYYQSVWIRLAHRLYSDFQYFCDETNSLLNTLDVQVFRFGNADLTGFDADEPEGGPDYLQWGPRPGPFPRKVFSSLIDCLHESKMLFRSWDFVLLEHL